MAVVISNGDVNINTSNGFYRVEAYNLHFSGVGATDLATTRFINPTFANAGSCKGVGIGIFSQTSTLNNRGINIGLQEKGSTFTVTIASPAVVTYNSHGFSGGEEVML